MKKFTFIFLSLLMCNFAQAKKVKFAVNMSGQVLSPNGIHITGDFQDEAGFPADWEANTISLLQEGATDIYSTVVDIPAFAKYEYKIVNGDLFYETEFIPVESRVGYNFNDNRWIYVDSTANDTTFLGAILFGGNAPAGLVMIRFIVDMQSETVASSGVYVDGNFQASVTMARLANLDADVYEGILYVSSGSAYEYRFYNGNIISSIETVPSSCSSNGNRTILPNADVVIPSVCFSLCTACAATSLAENTASKGIRLFPNPASSYSVVEFDDQYAQHVVIVYDLAGRTVRTYDNVSASSLTISKEELAAGVYFVNVMSENILVGKDKLVIE